MNNMSELLGPGDQCPNESPMPVEQGRELCSYHWLRYCMKHKTAPSMDYLFTVAGQFAGLVCQDLGPVAGIGMDIATVDDVDRPAYNRNNVLLALAGISELSLRVLYDLMDWGAKDLAEWVQTVPDEPVTAHHPWLPSTMPKSSEQPNSAEETQRFLDSL